MQTAIKEKVVTRSTAIVGVIAGIAISAIAAAVLISNQATDNNARVSDLERQLQSYTPPSPSTSTTYKVRGATFAEAKQKTIDYINEAGPGRISPEKQQKLINAVNSDDFAYVIAQNLLKENPDADLNSLGLEEASNFPEPDAPLRDCADCGYDISLGECGDFCAGGGGGGGGGDPWTPDVEFGFTWFW